VNSAPARRTPTPVWAGPAPTATSLQFPDELPVSLSSSQASPIGVPVTTQPFLVAGGRYSLSWSISGPLPCNFTITVADSVTPAQVRFTPVNRFFNRGNQQPTEGQTTVALTTGEYRLGVYADGCAWNLTLRGGPAS
jgi:hypothetical protein